MQAHLAREVREDQLVPEPDPEKSVRQRFLDDTLSGLLFTHSEEVNPTRRTSSEDMCVSEYNA